MAAIPFGNYELIERIAEGGMAEVWRARSRGVAGFEKAVVIKRVLPSLLTRPGFAELLVREAKIAARLSHPNVIQIFDLGEQDGSYYIAMELLRGRDLAAALSFRSTAEGPLSIPLRLWIAAEVAKALDYAHRAKGEDGKPLSIVHRDVSPQNVLLGFEGEVKVADFGIARADEAGLGRGEDPKILRGKYAYMSPEQARGEPLDHRSDIFSFGIVLYELMTRRRMFRGKSSAETLSLVREAKLPDFEARVPVPELVPVLRRALAPDREARFDSALEIHTELNRLIFAHGVPVGQTDLAAAMHSMFPQRDVERPNKLRADLLLRAYDDATAASELGPRSTSMADPKTQQTAALLGSKPPSRETRRLAFLIAARRPADEPLFESLVESSGGVGLEAPSGTLLAAFGLGAVERAVGHAARCALELRQRARLEGPARLAPSPPMAVLSGEAVVVEGARVEPESALLERAKELLSAVEPGEVRVAQDLRRELRRDFRLEDLGPSLRVEGYRSRRDRDAGELRRRAPLVGRQGIMRALSTALLDAAASRGQLLDLVGEPGVGKSRILAELRGAAAPQDFVFVNGRADEVDKDRSYGALADLVLDLCGIEPEDMPSQRFEKVERLRVLGLAPRELRLVGELIGLAYPLPERARVGRPRGIDLALAIRKALRALSKDRAVVLALEDLQWMDDATRQVLPLLIQGLVERRVLVIVTRRPGATGTLPKPYKTLEVAPLGAPDTGRLLSFWLGANEVEPTLAERVRRETGGVPLWIELVAELLPERITQTEARVTSLSGEDALPIPDAVRSVVAARIERLRPMDRSLLRVSAALAGVADVELVSAVEGLIGHAERAPLRRLLVRRLVLSEDPGGRVPERVGAWGGDAEDARLPTRVRLSSELLRRAVLGEMATEELHRLHKRIAAALERREAAKTPEGLVQLARHFEAAGEGAAAAEHHERAAERYEAREPLRAARHLVSSASLRAQEDPSDERVVRHALRAARMLLHHGGELAEVERALAFAGEREAQFTPADRVEHGYSTGRLARRALRAEDAVAAFEGIRKEDLEAVPAMTRAEVGLARGWVYIDAARTLDAAVALERASEDATGVFQGLALAGWAVALTRSDQLVAAEGVVSRALTMAARLGDGELRYASLAAKGALHMARSEMSEASARFSEALEVALATGNRGEAAQLAVRAAFCALEEGDDVRAGQRALAASRLARDRPHEGWRQVADVIAEVIEIRAGSGAAQAPVAKLVDSIGRLEALGRFNEATLAVTALAHAHVALGDAAAAARTLERATAFADRMGDRNLARRCEERRDALRSPG